MWFLQKPDRLQRERNAIEKLTKETDWLQNTKWSFEGAKLCLFADISAREHLYRAKMIYPASFPASPPTVLPREPNQHWSEHQYGFDGELCLEWGPDNWHEDITGAGILCSAHKLLYCENPLGERATQIPVPSRHALHFGQEIRHKLLRFLYEESVVTFIEKLAGKVNGTAKFLLMPSRAAFTAFIQGMKLSSGEQWQNQMLASELEKTALQIDAHFFKTSANESDLKSLTFEKLTTILVKCGLEFSKPKDQKHFFVFLTDDNNSLHLFLCSDDGKCNDFTSIRIADEQANGRLSPEFIKLVTKKVGIVGLGSAGSKIATSLARSGVRNFILIDHDIFMPENICRHELNWEDVGQHKVDGVARQLKLISKDIEVTTQKLMLSGQEATAGVDSVLSQLGECDLIIDATADPSTFNQLSSVANHYKVDFIWLEIFSGGIGGLLSRFRPQHDPDPKIMRAYLNGYLEKQDNPEIQKQANYSGVDRRGEIMVASDADVAVIAAHATRMALDILAEREPSIFPYSMYLIGLSRNWIFKEPFYTIPIDLSNVEVVEKQHGLSKGEIEENLAFIEQLLQEQKNENIPAA